MRQLTLIGERRLEWREVPSPALKSPLAAIVRPLAVAVCDFDRALVQGRYPALPLPIAIGHEAVAEVVSVGPEVRKVKPGMKVVLPLHVSCGTCPSCRTDRTNSCSSRPPLSNYGLGERGGAWGGMMSDLVHVPYADAMAAPAPAGLSPAECAAVGCNLVDMYRTVAPHLERYDSPRLLIVGGHASNMAYYGIVIARALGVAEIDYMDDDSGRLAIAKDLGARPVPLKGGPQTYEIVADCSADGERLALALSLVGPDGVCTPVWPYTGSIKLPVGAMFLRNATLVTGQPHAVANFGPVLKLMGDGKFSTTSIPHEILPWDAADEAFGFGDRKRIFVRG